MRTTTYLFGASCVLFAALFINSGCNRYQPKEAEKNKEEHAHPEKGPHGGPLAELGETEEYHAELVVDKGKKEATVYILDGKAVNGVPVESDEIVLEFKNEKPPVQVKLKAAPEKTDKDGSSKFVGSDDKFGGEMHPEHVEVSGIKVKGKATPLHGTFSDPHHKH